jgi:HEAT repeat protein
VPALIALLDDDSDRVRTETSYALGGYGSLARDALPKLQEIMHRGRGADALWATRAVKEIDPATDIGPRLRELFLTGERGVRHNIASWLPEHLPQDEARDLLLAQYQRETDLETREILAQAMNKVKE